MDERLEQLRLDRQQRLASGVVLDEPHEGEQPFLRCALCETDSNRFAQRCQTCSADLTTEEQRDFNRRLWAQRSAEADRERQDLARLEASRAEPSPLDPTVRAYGEAIASEVSAREERRLGVNVSPRRSAGMRILDLIPGPGWRFVALFGTAGLALLLGAAAIGEFRRGVRFGFAEILFLALLALFLPPRPRRRGLFGWLDDRD